MVIAIWTMVVWQALRWLKLSVLGCCASGCAPRRKPFGGLPHGAFDGPGPHCQLTLGDGNVKVAVLAFGGILMPLELHADLAGHGEQFFVAVDDHVGRRAATWSGCRHR